MEQVGLRGRKYEQLAWDSCSVLFHWRGGWGGDGKKMEVRGWQILEDLNLWPLGPQVYPSPTKVTCLYYMLNGRMDEQMSGHSLGRTLSWGSPLFQLETSNVLGNVTFLKGELPAVAGHIMKNVSGARSCL